LPKENKWMALISFDKWVHTGLFAVLLFLWNTSFNKGIKFFEFYLLLFAVLFGLSVEIIQREWIPNRSFDLYDLAADTLGSIIGLVIWWRVYKKNKPL
jgi:VanZ family protein